MNPKIDQLAESLATASLSSTQYTWAPLSSNTSIRVLQLRPARDFDEDLHCSLLEIVLPQLDSGDSWEDIEGSETSSEPEQCQATCDLPTLPFEAISYACGEFKPSVPLHVDGLSRVMITETLAKALRCLRRTDQDRLLWVDTVCINQSNNDEKSLQVGNMHRVYSTAIAVQIWLGPEDQYTEQGFATVERIAEECEEYGCIPGEYFQQLTEYTESQRDKIRELIGDGERGQVICSILQREYFKRRWIIQEITLASELVVNCGSFRLRWETFAQCIAVIRLSMTVVPASQIRNFWLWDEPHMAAMKMLGLRDQYHGGDASPSCNLIAMLKDFELTICRNPHDYLYSLLGAANDLHQDAFKRLKPDYSRDVELVFEDLTMMYLYRAQSVRVLHHVRNPTIMRHSFVPDWRVLKNTARLGGFNYGKKYLPYTAGIGDVDQPPQVVLTTEKLPAVLGWYVDEILDSHAMVFQPGEGYDRVYPAQLATWPIAFWHKLYEECRYAGTDRYPFTGEHVDTAFARTLVGDNQLPETKQFLADRQDPQVFRGYLEDILAGLEQCKEGDEGRLMTQRYVHELIGEQKSEDTDLRLHGGRLLHYLLAVALMVENRGFFLTNGSLIGIGPTGCERGDVVALIAGAETPFILRPVEVTGDEGRNTEDRKFQIYEGTANSETKRLLPKPSEERTKRYTVVGECYVHGIMDGYFMNYVERLRFFELQ
jgi:hypothetical protein